MVERTLKSFEAFYLLARQCFIHKRVKLLLFPAMTVKTWFKSLATFIVASNEGAALPILADVDWVPKEVRPSSEILKVVCVNTLSFIVLVIERTPLSFEEKHEEVKVAGFNAGHQVVHETHFQVFNWVSEGAVVAVFALTNLVRKTVTKLGLVLILMVQTLDSVVSSFTSIMLWAFLCFSKFAELWSV